MQDQPECDEGAAAKHRGLDEAALLEEVHVGDHDVERGDHPRAEGHAAPRPRDARLADRRRQELGPRDQQHDAGREPDAEGDGASILLETDREDDAEQRGQA